MASTSMSKKKQEPTETVLLRQAEPKYKFVGKKLPKEPIKTSQLENDRIKIKQDMTSKEHDSLPLSRQSNLAQTDSSLTLLPNQNRLAANVNPVTPQSKKPVAIVGASLKSKTSPPTTTQSSPSSTEQSTERISSAIINPQSPVSQSQKLTGGGATNSTPTPELYRSSITPPTPSPLSTTASSSTRDSALVPVAPFSPPTLLQNSGLSSPVSQSQKNNLADEEELEDSPVLDTSAAAAALSGVTHGMLSKRLLEVESERDKLRKDLDAQLQVNSELKRLLVASVGDDLGKRVERLAQDRVQLSMDIGGFSKKMNEDYENLDKMSIQADMWRSKYLASRVMVEELGNARAYLSLQWHESQNALQEMLNERHELRTNLLEAYKILQQVKDAFDPLNSHRSSTLASTNVLDLSRACQQLGEAVRFRLLPAHVATTCTVDLELQDSWVDSVTRAEQFAHELLSRPSEPSGSLQSGSSNLLPITNSAGATPRPPCPGSPHVTRFHPLVRHENVTYHCCKCQGEIRVV